MRDKTAPNIQPSNSLICCLFLVPSQQIGRYHMPTFAAEKEMLYYSKSRVKDNILMFAKSEMYSKSLGF